MNTRFSYFSNKFEFSDSMYQIANCNEMIKHDDDYCYLDLTHTGKIEYLSTSTTIPFLHDNMYFTTL